jgi:hypothetical protein
VDEVAVPVNFQKVLLFVINFKGVFDGNFNAFKAAYAYFRMN